MAKRDASGAFKGPRPTTDGNNNEAGISSVRHISTAAHSDKR
jgi:hypothetical protein